MKKIKVGEKYALIDDRDYTRLSAVNWHLGGNKGGYAIAYMDGRHVFMHRVVCNTPAGKQTDHINGNKLDNRRKNLRICTRSQNNANMQRIYGKSKFKGVSFCKTTKKWRAQIRYNGLYKNLGRFKTEKEAAEQYNRKAKEVFGEFAFLNKRKKHKIGRCGAIMFETQNGAVCAECGKIIH